MSVLSIILARHSGQVTKSREPESQAGSNLDSGSHYIRPE